MTDCVLDSSAVLAFLFNEPGKEVVRPLLRGGLISSVNAAEVIFKTFRNGESISHHVRQFQSLEMRVVDFDIEQAGIAATFKPYSIAANLSFADRACLALGAHRNLPIYTAETQWQKASGSVDVRLIRKREEA